MRKVFLLLSMLFPLFAKGQMKEEIRFEREMSWQHLLTRAKEEHKYIFVDYYATWCVPCKAMDKNVYNDPGVARLANAFFISIKVQLDTTKLDDPGVIAWRKDANDLKDRYYIRSLPTYLFFSPDGSIVHREAGYKNSNEFKEILSDALDPEKQYYTLIGNYRAGERKYELVDHLVKAAQVLGEETLRDSIAKDYIGNYLLTQKSDPYNKQDIAFIIAYTSQLSDKGFTFLYNNISRVNAIMERDNYAQDLLTNLISREIVYPKFNDKGKILTEKDWRAIESTVSHTYNPDISSRVILDSRIEYARIKQQWKQYVDLLIEKVNQYGAFGQWSADFNLNNLAWEIFLHTTVRDTAALNKALSWSNSAITINPVANWIDTKANILYKLGRKEEAIACQEQAVKVGARDVNAADYTENLNKMRNGEPTWPQNND